MAGMDLITQAKMFATQKHVLDNHQLYGQVVPYTHHLADVEGVLLRFGFEQHLVLRAGAWLHDVIEDTRDRPNKVTGRDIEEMFGPEVAKIVKAVTSEEGDNRKIRNALTYPKIREAGQDATILKLADRIANVKYGLSGGRALDMYKNEHPGFRHALYNEQHNGIVQRMWLEVDTLLEHKS